MANSVDPDQTALIFNNLNMKLLIFVGILQV